MLTFIAQYKVRSGQGDEVAEMLRHLVRETRAEPGCITYVVSRSVDDRDSFVLLEQYVDEVAFHEHRTSPHFVRDAEGGIYPLLERRTAGHYAEIEPNTD